MSTLIYAHRGASGYAPENTIAAFSLAIEQGAEGVELDVQFTRDKHLVVIHDERIDRVSNGSGRVCDISLKGIKKHKFGINHIGYEDEKAPTLLEVLELLKDTNLNINIELKNSLIPYEGLEEACLELVARLSMEDRILYSSFNHYSMLELKQLNPSARCGILYNCHLINPWEYAATLKVDAIHPHYSEILLTPEECSMAHEAGLEVNTWTVNEEPDMRKVILAGADILITNYPDRAIALRESL
jgi:glycerophosphoryl diester phosphodiesterase